LGAYLSELKGWFTYRLRRLTKRVALPFFCLVLTLARFVGLIGLSVIALHQYSLPEYNKRASWIIESVLIVSAVLDFSEQLLFTSPYRFELTAILSLQP
jgi:hypothetical protein